MRNHKENSNLREMAKLSSSPSCYNERRIYELDIAKVIGIFLVVLGHTYSNSGGDLSLRSWIYSFHMPLFFLISGMLHKEKGTGRQTLSHYFKSLLVPVFVFSFLYFLIYVPLSYYNLCIYNDVTQCPVSNQQPLFSYILAFVNYVTKGLVSGYSLPDLVLWFLVVLFYCKLWIFTFLRHRAITVVVYVCMCALFFGLGRNYLFLKQSCIALPFYMIGYQYKGFILKVTRRMNYFILMALFLVVNLLLTSLNGTSSMLYCVFSPNGYSILLSSAIYYVNAIFGIMFVLFASSKLLRWKLWFTKLSKSLISIVVLQEFFLSFYIKYVGLDRPLIITAFSSILIIFLCLVFDSFAMKHCKWVLGK